MKVKRYFSHSMQDALRQIREDLGPDAVILSNSKQNGGVEILATEEYDEEQFESAREHSSSQSKPKSKAVNRSSERDSVRFSAVSPSELARQRAETSIKLQEELEKSRDKITSVKNRREQEQYSPRQDQISERSGFRNASMHGVKSSKPSFRDADSQVQHDDAIVIMQQELKELRHLISKQSQQNAEDVVKVRANPAHTMLTERLESIGIQNPIRERLGERMSGEHDFDTAWAKVRKQLHSAMQSEYSEIIDMGGVVSLVGPTGSGKTMTVGKLAARYVMRHGAESLALVTTDRYRIAAHEQLKVFGRILNVPVHVVDEENCLDDILDKCSDRKLVLVDTAGLMQSDRSWNEQLKELKMSAHRIQNYLVMPATGQYAVMKSNYKHYKMVGLAGTILTKLDEAVSLGEAISYLVASKLSCAYVTDGQRVPEDIHLANKEDLLNKAEELLNNSERWVTIPDHDSAQQNADYALSDFA
jgi:flagellar biosynthesis protein FlhF